MIRQRANRKTPTERQRPRAASTWEAGREAGEGLTRNRIVAAGMAIADREGLAGVSIRRIAAHLNASPMALYHHVPSKRDLLNLMLDAAYRDFEWPAGKTAHARDALAHFAWESRRCLQRRPWVSLLRAADPEYGPQCMRVLESILSSLSQFGLEIRTAIRIIGVLFVFVNGFVAIENPDPAAPAAGERRSRARQPRFSEAVLATGEFPLVRRFVDMGAELPDDEGFARALNWILDGLAPEIERRGKVRLSAKRKRAAKKK